MKFPLRQVKYFLNPIRCLSTTKINFKQPEKKKCIPIGYKILKEYQSEYQIDDGLPIFLKRKNDVYLYKATLVLAIIGILYTLKFITSMM